MRNDIDEKINNGTSNEKNFNDTLINKFRFAWDMFTKEQKINVHLISKEYVQFLKNARNVRERVEWTIDFAKKNGFKHTEIGKNIQKLKPGDKIYYVNRNKNIALIKIGKKPITQKIHIIGSHLDIPCIDLKLRPLYDDTKNGLAMLKTHYYGGIKKYQWASIPLHLIGVIIKKDGTKIKINIGKDPNDPVFCIPDLLPHLMNNVQSKRNAREVIKGEELNILAGSLPIEKNKIGKTSKNKRFKLYILNLLNEKYGIKENDFQSAELSVIPGLEPRYVGFDKGMIGSPGQDDGICAWCGIKAILGSEIIPENTNISVIFDKEEIGSHGNTGAQSEWFKFILNDLLHQTEIDETLSNLHMMLSNIAMISADVGAAINPIFPSVHDPLNAAIIGKGVIIQKYSGVRGKYRTSEASAEFIAYFRNCFDKEEIPYQITELGKVDEGGGGTIARFFAEKFNCDVIDIGTPVIGMHSPYEITHIADLYATYLAYLNFFKE